MWWRDISRWGDMMFITGNVDHDVWSYVMSRLWRVPATLPYPDFFFTTRTLPGNFSKISGFRVVTIHAVFSLGLYQWCQPLSSCRKGFSKDCKHLHICPFTRFRNIKVKNLYKYRVRANISVIFYEYGIGLECLKDQEGVSWSQILVAKEENRYIFFW